MKDQYFFADTSEVEELYSPVVDFKIVDPMDLEIFNSKEFENVTYHLFMIDISNLSLSLNFSQYVLYLLNLQIDY